MSLKLKNDSRSFFRVIRTQTRIIIYIYEIVFEFRLKTKRHRIKIMSEMYLNIFIRPKA